MHKAIPSRADFRREGQFRSRRENVVLIKITADIVTAAQNQSEYTSTYASPPVSFHYIRLSFLLIQDFLRHAEKL